MNTPGASHEAMAERRSDVALNESKHPCPARARAWRQVGYLPVVLATAFMLGGCLSARRGEPLGPPVDVSDPVVARGQKVFFAHCHACHPHGQGGLGPALNNKPLPGCVMKLQIRQGLGAMPAFKSEKIDGEELDALVAYVKTLRRAAPRS